VLFRSHPTADEVYQVVRKRLPRVSLGTVYRNLEKLADNHLLLRLDSGSGPRRYDGRVENHYHIRCLQCSRVGDIFSDQPYPVPEELPGTDFDVIGLKVEYFGLCPDCRKKASKNKK
jgi:Fur family transcriptional regulator, ferric uptake regulator